ncbi:hypothetical protein [Mesorhizobium marinum]|uniref:hypothetical protein n=1 Tax=Mesorhizobium marinum TaxID=3228790 RepID=UPI003465CD08
MTGTELNIFHDKEPADAPAATAPDAPKKEWEMDWIDGPEIIIREYGSIALYTNAAGSIVIRQEGQNGDDDSLVFVSTVDAARVLIAALERQIGGAG